MATSRRINLAGQRFGNLVVTEFAFVAKDGRAFWHCDCDCGGKITTAANHLRVGDTISCGCAHKEWITKGDKPGRNPRHGHAGKIGSPEYESWQAMQSRCNNPNATGYHRYGGRGIKICERWRQFENFLADMGPRPADKSLDRIDPDGNYEPSNCRWAGAFEQTHNRSRRK